MCNPPFYSNDEEPNRSIKTCKRNAPHSVNTAQRHEATVEGGEVGFVKHLINESLILKERIKYSIFCLTKFQIIFIKKKKN
jgi:23S rRNA (adenine1618-N6)-methyltransferase